MVDVGPKLESERVAVARGRVELQASTLNAISAQLDGEVAELVKGDVIGVARVAGIMAAKRTSELIPLCHPLPLSAIEVDIQPEGDSLLCVEATVRTTARTGVEMEALMAVSVAGLAIYDMCKALDRKIVLRDVRLVRKTGGASGDYVAERDA